MSKLFKTSIHKPENFQILDDKRQKLLPSLGFSKSLNLYLAGGTGLALYLGHRTSIDFDFYRPEPFEKGALVKLFLDNLAHHQTEILKDQDGTFYLEADGVSLSCFYYNYPLIFVPGKTQYLNVASLEDIAAMKLLAIVQRGTFRDFVDIFYLLQKFSLAELLSWVKSKYPSYEEITVLKALIFFADAEVNLKTEASRIQISDPNFRWEKAKKTIKDAVISYQRSFLKNP